MSKVIVVESPAKSKTIEGYLGGGYTVVASFGHVRDLPKSDLGVDIAHHFKPKYIVPTKAKKTLQALKSAFAKADTIYLATDYDREGEAIAWHIMEACDLGKKGKKVARITFHEITKPALEEALKNPRDIDIDLVDAQQARRVLDRLVGYKLSPFLWKKIAKGLSAGRVQSVALRIIVDREREIEKFVPQEYWSVAGTFKTQKATLQADLTKYNNQSIDKLGVKNKADAETIKSKLDADNYEISSIVRKDEQRNPSGPFTTSVMQQEASRRLHMSSKQIMKLAQDLYEAGLITYMRTDSTYISPLATSAARTFIEKTYGKEYLSSSTRIFKTKAKGAQEAHEAIRPTHVEKQPIQLEGQWTPRHKDLYTLIWQRFVATQMKEAKLAKITVLINGKNTQSVFTATGQSMRFDGYLKVYPATIEERPIEIADSEKKASLEKIAIDQHFTEPPRRFTEASLIKTLEELGIGRPSTYAPTISTITERGYVRVERQTFFPQEIGLVVTDLLKEHFPNIVDAAFTATMEEHLDKVAEGDEKWEKVIDNFYQPFEKNLEDKMQEVSKQQYVKETGEKCPECGKPLIERLGRYGKFIACSGFPECKYAKPIVSDTGIACPDCKEGTLVERHTKKGHRLFWGCNRFPKCKYATWDNPLKPKKAKEEKATEPAKSE